MVTWGRAPDEKADRVSGTGIGHPVYRNDNPPGLLE